MTSEAGTRAVAPAETSPDARRVVILASVAALVADLGLMVYIGEIIPPLLVFAGLTLGGVALTARSSRAGLVLLALLAVAANGGGFGILLGDLSHPADTVPFLWAVLSGGGRLVVVLGVGFALMSRDAFVRPLVIAAAAVVVIALAGTVVARLTLVSDTRQAGDVEVAIEDFRFPEAVTVSVGDTLYLENRDRFRHSFTVEDADLDVMLAPGTSRRAGIAIPPGSYDVVCTLPGHEGMVATLEVA
jgi:plastocyanin